MEASNNIVAVALIAYIFSFLTFFIITLYIYNEAISLYLLYLSKRISY